MMQQTQNETSYQFSDNVERGDNMPIVAWKYGFREQSINGKVYLVPMTKDEYIEKLKVTPEIPTEHLEELLTRVRNEATSCFMYTTMACATPDGCQWCHLGNVGTSYYCYCRNWPW